MTRVATEVRARFPHLPIGIQVLSAANKEALAVAKAAGKRRLSVCKETALVTSKTITQEANVEEFAPEILGSFRTVLHDLTKRSACVSGLNFIRAEGFVFSHVGDEGPIHACAAELVRYRKLIGAEDVLIFTDVKKKHRCHFSPVKLLKRQSQFK